MEVYDCPNCSHTFKEIEAYCVDWRDPEKSFGCPSCETFLRKRDNRVTDTKKVWIFTGSTFVVAAIVSVLSNYNRPLLLETSQLVYAITQVLCLAMVSAAYPLWKSIFTKRDGENVQQLTAPNGRVRPFVEADRADVVSIWSMTFADDPSWNEPNTVINTKLSMQPELFLVYELEGQVVGTVIAGFDGFRGWLHHVAVHPNRQGLGIAQQMIRAAEMGLKSLGCRKVNLQVREGNIGAVERYAKMGFEQENRISMGKRL